MATKQKQKTYKWMKDFKGNTYPGTYTLTKLPKAKDIGGRGQFLYTHKATQVGNPSNYYYTGGRALRDFVEVKSKKATKQSKKK